jgi:hypothetical protein
LYLYCKLLFQDPYLIINLRQNKVKKVCIGQCNIHITPLRNSGSVESRTSLREAKTTQFSFVTTRNKNVQQQDAKSNVELCFVTNYRPNGQTLLRRPLNRLLEEVQASLLTFSRLMTYICVVPQR